MNNYLDVGNYAKDRMNDLIGANRRVEPWHAFALGRKQRPGLLRRLGKLWQDLTKRPERPLKKARR